MSDSNKEELERNAQEFVKSVLAEADKELLFDVSKIGYAEPTKAELRQQKKEQREREKLLRDKPRFLVFIADILQKIMCLVMTLYTVAGLSVFYFAWQIYKVCKVSGWHGLIETKYTLYIVAYAVVFALLKAVYFALYKYAND